jgi:ABC-type branched-subunit amino acid transport system substrate-binding protein
MEKKWRVKIERKKLLILGVTIVLIMALVSLAFGQESPKDVKTLQFGWLGSQTGWCSGLDVLNWQGAQLARDMVNERGGLTIKGQKYKLELLFEDCKCTTDGTVNSATKLVQDQNIKFIAGLAFWYAAAVKEICDPANVLRTIIFTCNTPGEIGADTPYNFLANDASFGQAIAVMDYLKKAYPKVKKVVIVTPDDGAIPYIIPTITTWLEQRGFTVVGKPISYPNEMTDFSPIAAQVVARKEADAIVMINGMTIHTGNILKGLRELGDNRLYAVSSPTVPKELLALSGKAAATNFVTIGPLPGAPGTPALTAEIDKRLTKKYGQAVQQQLMGFNSVWTMAYAINKAQSIDPVAVKEAWEKLDTIDTSFGRGSMGGLKTYGIRHAVDQPCPVYHIENGEPKFGAWMEVHTP